MALLEVKHLYKRFFSRGLFQKTESFSVLEDISFSVEQGEILGIVGESGCGKTTLARCILRLVEPTSGLIVFDGRDITHLEQKELLWMRKKVQVVFQNPGQALNMRKTIFETLSEVLLFHKICDTIEHAYQRSCHLLEEVKLSSEVLRRYPHELSVGQQQRVVIARALSVEPLLLILDECVSALDISIQAQILNLLLELYQRRHVSYLFISHDVAAVEHLADAVLTMDGGRVVSLNTI